MFSTNLCNAANPCCLTTPGSVAAEKTRVARLASTGAATAAGSVRELEDMRGVDPGEMAGGREEVGTLGDLRVA